MIFWITLIVFAGAVIGAILLENLADEWGVGTLVTEITAVISGITLLIMLIVLMCAYIGIDAQKATMSTTYESLVTQYENEYYENDNDVGKKELVKEIQEWNETITYRKIIQRNTWIGIFYPNIYDDYELIPLK